ncbi:MAG: sterol desaturase family protein, partial [Proteobacteria bacterium]|nr:sterol desaturase family protein [Pseudomonadota bacterium]
TNFRVHPLYTIMFMNIAAVFTGTAGGLFTWALGRHVEPITLYDSNVIAFTFSYLFEHLHHSHFWITFPGWFGKLFISPAHHQIHHSAEQKHFNTNYGNTLAIFDWMAGTLLLPTRERQKLRFGVDPITANDHSFKGSMVDPVIGLWRHIVSTLHAAGTEAANTPATSPSPAEEKAEPTSVAR